MSLSVEGSIGSDAYDSMLEDLKKGTAGSGRTVKLKGRWAWPEFIFKHTVITLDIEGMQGQWYVESVSVDGLVLIEVV